MRCGQWRAQTPNGARARRHGGAVPSLRPVGGSHAHGRGRRDAQVQPRERWGSAQVRVRRAIGTRVPGAFDVNDDATIGHKSCSTLVIEHLDVPPDSAGDILALEINGSACSRHARCTEESALPPPALQHAQIFTKGGNSESTLDKECWHKTMKLGPFLSAFHDDLSLGYALARVTLIGMAVK